MDDKLCKSCDTVKPVNEFAMKHGKPAGKCKLCFSAYYKQYYKDNPDKYDALKKRINENRPSRRLKNYGLTEDEYDKLMSAYEGLCHICKSKPATAIDHDHETGAVRGVLCALCNVGLGALGDTLESIRSALSYLEGA